MLFIPLKFFSVISLPFEDIVVPASWSYFVKWCKSNFEVVLLNICSDNRTVKGFAEFNGDVKDETVSDRTDTSEKLDSDTKAVFDDNFRWDVFIGRLFTGSSVADGDDGFVSDTAVCDASVVCGKIYSDLETKADEFGYKGDESNIDEVCARE